MKVTIDRFEGDMAVVEIAVGQFATLSKTLVPGAKSGDVIYISIDTDETQKQRDAVEALMDDLFTD